MLAQICEEWNQTEFVPNIEVILVFAGYKYVSKDKSWTNMVEEEFNPTKESRCS